MRMSRPAVMDPFALTPRGDEADALEVSKVAGNLRLHHAKAIGQMADADFAMRQQIEQPQSIGITQAAQEANKIAMQI